MKGSNIRFSTLMLLSCSFLFSTSGAFAEEGELWQAEVKMEMPGMPAMPPQSVKQCVPKKTKAEREEMLIPKDPACKTTDFKKSGSKTSFKLTCNSNGASMTGAGEVEQLGDDGYRGKMHMVMNQGKEKMEMSQSFSGKKLGKCDYQPPKSGASLSR